MSPEMVRRMVPHDGDFGMAQWALCEATAVCIKLHAPVAPVQGYFAIVAGEANYVDPLTHKHVHADCYRELTKDPEARL